MKKEQKQNIKNAVNEGLGLTLDKLKISKPTSKTERKLKKLSKKLASRLKVEVEKSDKIRKSEKPKKIEKEVKAVHKA